MAISTQAQELLTAQRAPHVGEYVRLLDGLFLRDEAPPPGLHWSNEVFQRMLVNRVKTSAESFRRARIDAIKFEGQMDLARAAGGK